MSRRSPPAPRSNGSAHRSIPGRGSAPHPSRPPSPVSPHRSEADDEDAIGGVEAALSHLHGEAVGERGGLARTGARGERGRARDERERRSEPKPMRRARGGIRITAPSRRDGGRSGTRSGGERRGDGFGRTSRGIVGLGEHDRQALVAAAAGATLSGTLASRGTGAAEPTESRPATSSPPPEPNRSRMPPPGWGSPAMFSTTPTTSWPVSRATSPDRSDVGGGGLRGGHDDHLGVPQPAPGRSPRRRCPAATSTSHVEVAEVHVGEELLEGAVEHRPPPK